MTFRISAFIVLALALSCAPARAEGLVLKIHLQVQETNGAASPVVTQKDYTVTLFPQIVDVRSGDSEQVYDFAGRHLLSADLTRHTLTSFPLYAIPASHRMERELRLQQQLSEMKKTRPAATIDDVKDVNVDMLYGSESNSNTSGMISTTMLNGTTSFTANNESLASFAVSNIQVPETLRQSYMHFFIYNTSLHPVIDRAVAQAGAVFSTLVFVNHDGSQARNTTLTIASAEKTTAEGPELRDFEPAFLGNIATDSAIRKSLASPMRSQQQLEARISNQLARKDYLRAVLAAKEMELMLGIDAGTSSAGKAALQTNDAIATAAIKAIQDVPRSTDEFLQHMQTFNKAKELAPDFAYLIELFRADQIRFVLEGRQQRSSDEQTAMNAAFQKLNDAIIFNPWLTGAYCDLGDAYFAARRTDLAWLLWEQAARLDPHYPKLERAAVLQQQILKDFPEYF